MTGEEAGRQCPEAGPIVLLHLGALGDLVLLLPAIERARQRGAVWLLGAGTVARLFEACGAVARGIDATTARLAPLFATTGAPWPLPPPLDRAARPGAHWWLYGSGLEALAQALRRVGLRSVHRFPPRPREDTAVHAADQGLWAACAALGEPPPTAPARPRLVPPRAALERLRGEIGARRFVTLHPGSGGVRKCWPLERWIALAQRLQRERGQRVCMVLGPIERERWPQLPRRLAQRGLACRCPEDLEQLAAVLALSRLHVGNDAGPSHLAAALGTPTLTLFGPTDPAIWAPRAAEPDVPARVVRATAGLGALELDRVYRGVCALL